jgi:hypothetical protein
MKYCFVDTRKLLLVALVVSIGCQSRTPPTTSNPAHLQVWQSQEHEVGDVIAGFEITHTFTFTNDLTGVLKIQKDGDIVRNCNCADIIPAARELAPGAATAVTVKVDTRDKVGSFSYGGRIIWTDAENTPRVAVFALTGVARPPMLAEPDTVVFERDAVAKGQSKEFKLVINPAVDEGSLTIEASKALAIEHISSKPGSRVYSVKCLQQPQGEDDEFHEIYLTAKLVPQHGGIPFSTTVVVHVAVAVPLEVQPKSLDLQMGPDGRATGKLVLAGDAMMGGDNIESITCGDYKVEWKTTRSGPNAPRAVVEVTIVSPTDRDAPAKSILQVKVKGLVALHVPIHVRK